MMKNLITRRLAGLRRAQPIARASTHFNNRFIRMENSKFHIENDTYPTAGNGHDFRMNIFGLLFNVSEINAIQDSIFNNDSFLPSKPASPLPKETHLNVLSDIAQKMAVVLEDKSSGLLAHNELRKTVLASLDESHFETFMNILKKFKTETNPEIKKNLAQVISDVAFWCQWLIRGFLFEGKLHFEMYCADVIPANLSKIAFAANAALGRHQIEFVYDDYTLKAANFPKGVDLDAVNYDDPESILNAIRSIRTPVGFNDMLGGSPEHNFRHNHSLMEHQMKMAFRGFEQVIAGNDKGWDLIVEASRRANRVFKTMLMDTPADTYPAIRLPIKGVRGACGSVYSPHGVFYEGVGSETFVKDGKTLHGIFIDNEWGQTGANSSMYKYFDILIGVAQVRSAFGTDPIMINKMQKVYNGEVDSSELGSNPIDSMQRAFDLFTRPIKHMKMLVNTDKLVKANQVMEDKRVSTLLQRLRLAYWVAEHRITHGQYVLRAIYQTEPIGGQSRADGTGGSTPPFLKLFLDQTLGPGRSLLISLLLMPADSLTHEQRVEIQDIANKFDVFEQRMTAIRDKGQQLEHDEKNRS